MPMHSAMIEMISPAAPSVIPSPFLISSRIGAGASQVSDWTVRSRSRRSSIIQRYGDRCARSFMVLSRSGDALDIARPAVRLPPHFWSNDKRDEL